MIRRYSLGLGLFALASILAGCDYQNKKPPILPSGIVDGPLPTSTNRSSAPIETTFTNPDAEAPIELSPEEAERGKVILGNVVKLMETASTNPGGQNFAMATENLNELFERGTKPAEFDYNDEAKKFLFRKIGLLQTIENHDDFAKTLMSPKFTIKDARHIEDCMLYHVVATRIAGEGDDLTRVRRIFDWIVRNVELVPAESLGGGGLRQAQSRPADVLVRGMATEYGGYWSERGWLFMSLCRQIGVDVGILTFSPKLSNVIVPNTTARPPIAWVTAAAIDGKLYLFEQRLGIEIPGPDGTGVATLEEALTNPIVLSRLEIPGYFPYGTTGAEIAASSSGIGVLLDSSPGYFAPRMRLLQGRLKGSNRTILFRDLLDQAKNFAAALGQRVGKINLWELPILVERSLFSSPDFVRATQMPLQFFDGKLPLLYARTAHLRGDLVEAINKYVELRLRQDGVQRDADKTPISPEVQKALDVYATYYLAQCQMDQGNVDQAENLFKMLLKMTPEPGPGRYFYYMLRWSAISNLGRICEKKGDKAGAIQYYSQSVQINERHGNWLKAREIVLNNPFLEPAPAIAAPPDPSPAPVAKQVGK